MTYRPKVSVIIPCFNHGEFLREAVSSVLSTNREDAELIVVDDGSTNERTRSEADKLSAEGVTIIRQPNKGLAAARNAGIAASSAKYIFPLDADDRMHSGWVDRAIGILDSDPKVGVVYGDARCFGCRTYVWRVGSFDLDKLLSWNYIHASALYRRVVWEQNGGYDASMPAQGLEDWDFWLGAVEHSWQFAYIPEISFEYRQHNESMNTRARGFHNEIRQFIARKHGPLYQREWERLEQEHRSIRATARNLRRLINQRLKKKRSESNPVSS